MGFKPPKREYKLIFADPDMQGLEVIMRSSSIAAALESQRLGAAAKTGVEETDALVRLTASALVSWNLEDDDGTPIPATYEGLAAQQGFIFWAVFNGWVEAVTGAPAPLADGSTSGESAPEASIPMETLSPSPLS